MIEAYVLLDVDPIYLQEPLHKLDSLEEVDKIDSVFGEFNMLIYASSDSQGSLKNFINSKIKVLGEVRNSSVLLTRF